MKVFISYRRSDSQDVAGRLYDHLERRIGSQSVFKDVDSIPLGADFRAAVREAIGHSDLMVVLIGPGWLSVADESGRKRLDNPADLVRIEIETALGSAIQMVPVLLGDAQMPRAQDLPSSLNNLAFRNAARLRPDPDFKSDVNKLCQELNLPEATGTSAPNALKSLQVSSSLLEQDHLVFRYTLLFGSPEAIVPVSERRIDRKALEKTLESVAGAADCADLERIGEELTGLLLPPQTRELLAEDPDVYLIVFHDGVAGRLPWELLHVGGTFPALRAGLSRRLLSGRPLRGRGKAVAAQAGASVLIVTNPTEDLPGTAAEGEQLVKVITTRFPSARLVRLEGKSATKARFRENLTTGDFDIVHFAGHGHHDDATPEDSGIFLAGMKVFGGQDLATAIPHPPKLVFISAAEIAQLSDSADRKEFSLAEAFLGAGVGNFVSASWPEQDLPAAAFVSRFYDVLLRGSTIGTAIREARLHLWGRGEIDCLNYVHVGLPENVVLLE